MNSSFLTKHLSKLALVINLTVTTMIWLYCIGTTDPLFISLIQSYAFVSVEALKIIITVICGIWIIRSVTAYELRVIQFVQADLLKAILMELQSTRKSKQIDNADTMMDDIKIDFDKVKL